MSKSDHPKPTVGRIVHYFQGDGIPQGPLAAIITGVESDELVSLTFFSPAGSGAAPHPVPRKDVAPRGAHRYWEWPPFVPAGAAKLPEGKPTEAEAAAFKAELEKKIAEADKAAKHQGQNAGEAGKIGTGGEATPESKVPPRNDAGRPGSTTTANKA